jgi:large subunit ribosomal protein L10
VSRQVKRFMIDSIQASLSDIRDLLVVDVSRVSAVSINRIRHNLAERSIRLISVRNAVASRALVDLGLSCAEKVLVGPSAIVFGTDDISTISKEVSKCVLLDKAFEIRSGIADGRVLSAGDIDELIKSPGKAELLSRLSALMLGPGSRLASTISGSYGSLSSQIERRAEG